MTRRHRLRLRNHPQLFPPPEETVPLAEQGLRSAIRGFAEMLLTSLDVSPVRDEKGGVGEPEDHA